MKAQGHPKVIHPRTLITEPGKFNLWLTDHMSLALGSIIGLYLAFSIPLVALAIPALYKVVGLVFSYWIQSWGLFALQNKQIRDGRLADAKQDTDHVALTHIATRVDAVHERGAACPHICPECAHDSGGARQWARS